jgi:3',5'-cyclic-AMP phosphodiesterase
VKRCAFVLVSLGLLALACTDVADERAARDEAVGHYRDDATRIDVDDGLAVIRSVEAGSIVFWSNAPAWSMTLQVEARPPVEIEVRNLVKGSTLETTALTGESLGVRLIAEPTPTTRRFLLDAPQPNMRLSLVPPAKPKTTKVRFAVLSDIQTAIVRIQDVYQRISEEPDLDFVLSTGDLTNQGTPAELERFEAELGGLPIPFYCTLGNHELGTDPPPFQDRFGRATSHFHYRGVGFSLVDSASATLAARSRDWLDGWLDHDRARVHVFATHFPPIDPIGVRNGSFASRAEAHQLIARLAAGRVDLSLHGHVHSYYAFTMAGIPAYISGGGGALPERFDDIGRHFLVVEVGASQVESVSVVRVD